MKQLLILFSLMAITTVTAHNADYKAFPGELRAENNVFEVPGKNASELYQLTKKWMANTYENHQRVLKMDDENQLIKINHYFDIKSPKKVKFKYNILIDFKDEKVQITFTDIRDTYSTKYSKFFNDYGTPKKLKSVQKSIEVIET